MYKDLTRSDQYPLGGQAYLDIEEDTDQPYLSGIKYHAMPPLKRFRDMEHLSGGEKTMAALALLFAIHSYKASPFFVLDEVDAALDNANVEKIKNYIREHAGPNMQFIVISLKTGLFQDSESLVGVYRDQEVNSSRTLTLDVSNPLSFFPFPIPFLFSHPPASFRLLADIISSHSYANMQRSTKVHPFSVWANKKLEFYSRKGARMRRIAFVF